MKKLYATMMIVGMFLLSACNGSSGDNDTPTTPNTTVSSITISLQNAQGVEQQSFDSSDIITVVATVYDENNSPISGKAVTFTAELGELSLDSKLSDASGEARVTLSNPLLSAGAGTTFATSGSANASIDYEFLRSSAESPSTISTEIRLDGVLVNRFRSDEQVQVTTTLHDSNNSPIANEVVTFTADKGSLVADSALTNAQGQASVVLLGSEDLGVGNLWATTSENTGSVSDRVIYEVIAPDAIVVDEDIRIGYFDGSDFIEGQIKLSVTDSTISAGGTLGLRVDLVNASGEQINEPTPVAFTSNCVVSGQATIDATVNTIKGKAESTFEDIDCAGVSGTDDVIIASVTSNGVTNTATATISITGEELGSIEFISAEPTSIVLKGTGGQGRQENSTLTFLVKSALGNPLAQQPVDFILDTNVGGIELTPASGLTNSEGIVTTKVNAGTVPTAVRVTAKSTMTVNTNEINVQTQSDLLSINTGLPEQSSMTISTSVLNPEAFNINGVTTQVTAQLADNFNNPVPDGTTVNFTTEGGNIGGSCATVNGACSVTWTSSNPKPSNHRVTILATASGHETFFESNGNNIFDDEDGTAISDACVADEEPTCVSSGFARVTPKSSGFVDMSEAWRDDNEDGAYSSGEKFIDFNNDGEFSKADGLFNGPQCDGALCAAEDANNIHVRKALVMIMSSSSSFFRLSNSATNTLYFDNNTGTNIALPNIADNSALGLSLSVSDTALQSMPEGTTISVAASVGEISGVTSLTVGNTSATSQNLSFIITNPLDGDPEIGTLTVEITAPSGTVSSMVKQLTLD